MSRVKLTSLGPGNPGNVKQVDRVAVSAPSGLLPVGTEVVDTRAPDRWCRILFNESFAATNEREGSEVGRQIITALREQNIKILFVTHLYDLATACTDNTTRTRSSYAPNGNPTAAAPSNSPRANPSPPATAPISTTASSANTRPRPPAPEAATPGDFALMSG